MGKYAHDYTKRFVFRIPRSTPRNEDDRDRFYSCKRPLQRHCRNLGDFKTESVRTHEESANIATFLFHYKNDTIKLPSILGLFSVLFLPLANMCWSAEVSLCFAILDTLFVALLLARPHIATLSKQERKRISLCTTYAGIMAGVALQEWGQFAIWERNRLGNCTEAVDVFLAILTTGAAMLVPIPLLVASYDSRYMANSVYQTATRSIAIVSWIADLLIIIFSLLRTQEFCVNKGPNHHQIWLCESATYQVGGHLLQYTCIMLYTLCCLCSIESISQMPFWDRRRLQTFALVSVSVCTILFGDTLETCSVWCWSAFILGVSLCAQAYGYLDHFSALIQKFCTAIPKYHVIRLMKPKSVHSGPATHGL